MPRHTSIVCRTNRALHQHLFQKSTGGILPLKCLPKIGNATYAVNCWLENPQVHFVFARL